MSYSRFRVMLEAGYDYERRREASVALAMIQAAVFPQLEDKTARERIVKGLLKVLGEDQKERTAAEDLAALDKLRMYFPTPSPDVMAEIERAKAEYAAKQAAKQ